MGLQSKQYYFWLLDANGKFLYATYDLTGKPVIKKQSQPIPLQYSPSDLIKSKLSFATNQKYFSLNRTITYPLKFIKDGADILRWMDYNGNGYESICYLVVTKLNTATGINELAYRGKIDFSRKVDDPRTGYTVSTLDESAWSILSANESVLYQIDCSPTNPKAVRVLFDGVTLRNKVTYQSIGSQFQIRSYGGWTVIPFSLINQDGDSAGVVYNNQILTNYERVAVNESNGLINGELIYSVYPLNGFRITGTYSYRANCPGGFTGLWFKLVTVIGGITNRIIMIKNVNYRDPNIRINDENIKDIVNIDITLDLAASERVFLFVQATENGFGNVPVIIPEPSNLFVSVQTVTKPQICYGLRAFDLLQGIVSKATRNKYTIRSNYFENNDNLDICFSGDAIRQIPNAYIQSSFSDWFKSFDCDKYLAMRIINGVLWIEPATTVYAIGDTLMDLGEISNLNLMPAIEYVCNEVKVGSTKQDYRHSNGRYEFNSTNSFSLPVKTVQKSLDLVSKYRRDSYGISFLILDYQGSSTKDNLGDTNVFVVRITNEQASATTNVETFIQLTVDNAPLAPFIRYPFQGAWITNDKPTIQGVAPAGSTVNIYADHSLDGGTTADSNGNWSYTLVNALSSFAYTVNPDGSITVTASGQHTIDATFTDDGAAVNSVTITVDTTSTTSTAITSLADRQNIYDNKPLLKGVSQTGDTITIKVDNITIGTTTADGSGLWFYQLPRLTNATHKIEANAIAINVNVNNAVDYPLVTSFSDGFVEVNNLPTISGVSMPNETVTLYLNYQVPTILASTRADSYGNWSVTVVPQPYPINPPIPYIPNGLNIVSTSLTNQIVQIAVSGYKLDRPTFSEISGVIDNTVFNTHYSPKRMLQSRGAFWKSILWQIPQAQLSFEAADKNALLKTVLNGITTQENTPLKLSDVSDSALFLPIKAKFRTRVPATFNQILYDFNSGGVIQGEYRGNVIYFMPVGQMTQANVTDEVQEWELLLSPLNDLNNIMQLSRDNTTLDMMKNAISISDYNPLHFVVYNFEKNEKYNTYQMFEEWFKDRNLQYITQPDYLQKWQTSDNITIQIVNDNLSGLKLKMYNCYTGTLIDTIDFAAVPTQPTVSPKITLEALITLSDYGEGEYFFVIYTNTTPIAISERINVKDVWSNTILIEANDINNKPDTFFSTGFTPTLRVEGLVTNFIPEIVTWQNKDEIGNNQMLHSIPSKKKTIYFGDPTGLPDYMANKISLFTQLSNCNIEGQQFVMIADSKLEPNETDGYPMFYYKLDLELAKNRTSNIFAVEGGNVSVVTLAVDASAFNGNQGTIINVELTNE